MQLRDNKRTIGVVNGLRVGTNQLIATFSNGQRATSDIQNHPNGGPIFSVRKSSLIAAKKVPWMRSAINRP